MSMVTALVTALAVYAAGHLLLAAVLGLPAAVAAGTAGACVWIYHSRGPGHFSMLVAWDAIDPPENCPECGGIGMTNSDRTAIKINPLRKGEAYQHLAFARGNGPVCPACLGQGTRPRRLPRPATRNGSGRVPGA